MGTNEEILAQLIASHKRAIRYLLASTLGLILLGVVVIVISVSLGKITDVPTGLISLAGVLTSSLGALPLKDLLSRQEKVEYVTIIQARYRLINNNPNAVDVEERKRILQYMAQIVEKAILG